MLLKSHYFFNGVVRYSYGWENPNHAAAVLVCLIPLFWAAELNLISKSKKTFWLYIVRLGEVLISLSVALTYSRGSATAWVVSLFFFGFLATHLKNCAYGAESRLFRFLLFRLLLLFIILFATTLTQRFALAAVGDASVTHRLTLWHGGLQLIEARPLTGWGKGNSGYAFMQWLQTPGIKNSYGGMVNSYLQVAVEFGLPGFFVLCFILLLPVTVCFRHAPTAPLVKREVLCGCAASLCGFSVASIFSTLVTIPTVVWMPLGLVLLIIYNFRTERTFSFFTRDLAFSAGGAVGLCAILYGACMFTAVNEPWRLSRTPDGALRFVSRQTKHRTIDVTFLPDQLTLGPYFGREIRGAVAAMGDRIGTFTIYPTDVNPGSNLTGTVVAFGPRVHDLREIQASSALCGIFPVGQPLGRKDSRKLTFMALPEYDQIGNSGPWQALGCINPNALRTVEGAGQDVRAQWPQLLQRCLLEVDHE